MIKLMFITVLLMCAIYFISQDGKICINHERAGIILLRGGYRAWWIRYSDGLKYPYRKWKDNLWCPIRIEHCDVRPLLKKSKELEQKCLDNGENL